MLWFTTVVQDSCESRSFYQGFGKKNDLFSGKMDKEMHMYIYEREIVLLEIHDWCMGSVYVN